YVQIVHRLGDLLVHVRRNRRRLMAVDVDDRELRTGHRMFRHDERRSRLVVADAGRRPLRLTSFSRTRANLAWRLLCGSVGEEQRDDCRKNDRCFHRREKSQQAYKPNSVPPLPLPSESFNSHWWGFGETTIPLAPPSLAESSDRPGGFGRAVL